MKLFGVDTNDVDKNNIEFVYVEFIPFDRNPTTNEYHTFNPNCLGHFEWGAKGIGFGQIAWYRMGHESNATPEEISKGNIPWFDAEMMSKSFIKQMLAYWVDNSHLDHDVDFLPIHFKC